MTRYIAPFAGYIADGGTPGFRTGERQPGRQSGVPFPARLCIQSSRRRGTFPFRHRADIRLGRTAGD